MDTEPMDVRIAGSTASEIAASIEAGIAKGELAPGRRLPTVRALAQELAVSPATVHAAFRTLRERGLVAGSGRAGTRVAERSTVPSRRLAARVPQGARNLADGNPDPALLPDLKAFLPKLSGRHWLYGEPGQLPALVDWARADFTRDGLVAADLLVVGGALDGVERALEAHLRPGDAVVVEDPGYGGILDLLPVLGLRPIPVPVDADGMVPDGLARALTQRPAACVITPRVQNPTGAALTEPRAAELTEVLRRRPDVLVIEDDHAGPVSGAQPVTVAGRGELPRWAVIRSLTKTLGPDIRLGVLSGDHLTVSRMARRQQAGAGWVSHLIQELAVTILTDPSTPAVIETARTTYADRRRFVAEALARRDIPVTGRSGFNMWIPVTAEGATVGSLLALGWAVRAGESFRSASAPGLRVTVSTVDQADAESFADALDACLRGGTGLHTA